MDMQITTRVVLAVAAAIVYPALAGNPGSAGTRLSDPCTNLLQRICQVNASAEKDAIAQEKAIVREFVELRYARLPVSLMPHEVDFAVRYQCFTGITEFAVVKTGVCNLREIAETVYALKPLDVKTRAEDLAIARSLLLRLCHTAEEINEFNNFKPDGKHMRGALLVDSAYEGWFSDIRTEYDARARYNDALDEYKRKIQEWIMMRYDEYPLLRPATSPISSVALPQSMPRTTEAEMQQ